jgi:nitroreductase
MTTLFHQPVTEVIRRRSSWRTYEHRPIAAATLDTLQGRLRSLPRGPFGGRIRVELHAVPGLNHRTLGSFGTYGVIIGAHQYLVGAMRLAERDHEDFGYVFEHAILAATDLGLGTCWLGGTLDRSTFGERMGITAQERVPAVSPVGYASARRAWRDQALRLGAGSHRRKEWERLFFDGSFDRPLSLATAGRWSECLEMVRLGPSGSNQQPWRMVRDRDGHAFHLYRERTRAYRLTDRLGLLPVDIQRIDLGIAMAHFELTARALGLPGRWERWPTAPAVGALPEHAAYLVSWVSE